MIKALRYLRLLFGLSFVGFGTYLFFSKATLQELASVSIAFGAYLIIYFLEEKKWRTARKIKEIS